MRTVPKWEAAESLMTAMGKDPQQRGRGGGASGNGEDWARSRCWRKRRASTRTRCFKFAFEGAAAGGDGINGRPCSGCAPAISGENGALSGRRQNRVLAVFFRKVCRASLPMSTTAKNRGYDTVIDRLFAAMSGPSRHSGYGGGGYLPETPANRRFKKQRDLRGLFEFDMTGQQLDDYVKKQVTDYREQAEAFGLAKQSRRQ